MVNEEWRIVPGWPEYSVSSFGSVCRNVEGIKPGCGKIRKTY